MATEIVRLCDRHLADEGADRVFATHAHAVILDGTEFAIDLCDECETKVYEPLHTLITVNGVKVGKSATGRPRTVDTTNMTPARVAQLEAKRAKDRERRRTAKPLHPNDDGVTSTCPVCGFVASTRFGLAAHAHGKHEIKGLDALFAHAQGLTNA